MSAHAYPPSSPPPPSPHLPSDDDNDDGDDEDDPLGFLEPLGRRKKGHKIVLEGDKCRDEAQTLPRSRLSSPTLPLVSPLKNSPTNVLEEVRAPPLEDRHKTQDITVKSVMLVCVKTSVSLTTTLLYTSESLYGNSLLENTPFMFTILLHVWK